MKHWQWWVWITVALLIFIPYSVIYFVAEYVFPFMESNLSKLHVWGHPGKYARFTDDSE